MTMSVILDTYIHTPTYVYIYTKYIYIYIYIHTYNADVGLELQIAMRICYFDMMAFSLPLVTWFMSRQLTAKKKKSTRDVSKWR